METEQLRPRHYVRAVTLESWSGRSSLLTAPASLLATMGRLVVATGALVLLALGATAFALRHGGNTEVDGRVSPATPQHFGSAELEAFDALRGPTRPLPSRLGAHLRRFRLRQVSTLWLSTAKYVPTGNGGFWVVNGRNDTCIVQAGDGGLSCVQKIELFRIGAVIGYVKLGRSRHKPREFVIWGLAPNWIKTAILQVGAKKKTIAIRHNAYSYRSKSPVIVKRLERRPPSGASQAPKQ